MATDLELAVTALTAKRSRYSRLWNYYDGQQPLVYNTAKLQEIFHGINARFTMNWCAVVVDSVLDRMSLLGVGVPDADSESATLADLWSLSGLVHDIDSVHEEVVVTGESFVIAWLNPETEEVEAFHNAAHLVHVEYATDNPRHKKFAAKWWQGDERTYLTLYYPDRLEYYATGEAVEKGALPTGRQFEPLLGDDGEATAENPFGVIPVFHFRSSQRKAMSQIANVIEPQDAINKLMADMMVAAEFGAYKQRYVISAAGLGKNQLKNSPNEIWDLPAGVEGEQATSAGQFDATDLTGYLAALDKISANIGVITRTPKHYFYSQGGDPSGEALIALESPLNKKTGRLINCLVPTWQELAAFLLVLDGKTEVSARQVFINYDKPATVQPRTAAEIRKLNRESGLPLRTVLRDEGWDEADLQQLEEDLQAEGVSQANYAAATLSAAQRNFDRGEV